MLNKKSLIVVDMQEKFLGEETKYPDFYFERRRQLIEKMRERIAIALDKKQLVINITFGDSRVLTEVQDLLCRKEVRQFSKYSDGLFLKSIFRQTLDGNSINRSLICSDKSEYNSIYPKKGVMGYPIKELLCREGSCDIVGVSTVECVLAVNLDLQYLANRVRSSIHFRVLGSLCMTSNPQYDGKELSEDNINDLYSYYRLPHPIWNNPGVLKK